MSGQGDARAMEVIEHTLAVGRAGVLELLAALREREPALLRGREGAVHAVLYALVRKGRVAAVASHDGGPASYLLPEAPQEGAGPPVAAPAAAALEADVRKVVAGVRDPAVRARIAADVTAHRAELREAGRLAQFGSLRGVEHLLRRVDRGRPTFCLTHGAADGLLRLLVHEGPWLLGAVAVFLALKVFIVPVYKIPSRSMVPTLQVGDRVAVFLPHVGGTPERWSIVTYELGDTTYVKRLVGLSGEEIAILHGDVYANGVLLAKPDDVRAALRAPVETWPFLGGAPAGLEGWARDGALASRGSEGFIWLGGGFPAHPGGTGFLMRDGYAVLEGERDAAGRLVLVLRRGPAGGDEDASTQWTLAAGPEGVRLDEQHVVAGEPRGAAEVLARSTHSVASGALRLELSYVDGVLRASCAGWHWKGARRAPDAALGLSVGVQGTSTHIREVRVDRDLHYSHAGSLGVPTAGRRALNPHRILGGHVFCLGDNTTDSRDSRFRDPGDIPEDALIGAVRLRVWPPGRWGRVK